MVIDYSILERSHLFRGLPPGTTEILLMGINYRIKSFNSGSVVAARGDEVRYAYIVIEGVVRGEMGDASGKVLSIEEIGPGRILAPAFIFGSLARFPVTVVAAAETVLMIINREDFVNLLRSSEKVLTNFLDAVSDRSQFLSEKLRFITFKTIRAKLAQYILDKAGERLFRIRLEVTQQQLADYFGVARPSLARTLRELSDEGLIESTGKEITITDREGLEALTAISGS